MGDTLELGDGRWRLVVAPGLGGSLLACEHDGRPVLQPAAQPAGSRGGPARCCHFPLIPFSNRIENGRFHYGSNAVRLAPNVAGSPHALHGHGWQSAWQVTGREAARCTLSFEREAAPDWPWAYRGRQTIEVAGNALHLALAVENHAATAMPCGLGFHPFFPRSSGTRLQFEAGHVWDGSATAFPRKRIAIPAPLDFVGGPHVSARERTDHCFDGWRGRATLSEERPARVLELEACAAASFVIVFIPGDADYLCVEPVTHAVNAVNLADASESGLWTLEPGAMREVWMTIRCGQAAGN
jgi:aldose 1-epimerase